MMYGCDIRDLNLAAQQKSYITIINTCFSAIHTRSKRERYQSIQAKYNDSGAKFNRNNYKKTEDSDFNSKNAI